MSKNNKTSIDTCVSDNNLCIVKSLGTLHPNISYQKNKKQTNKTSQEREFIMLYRSFIHYRNRVHIHLNK